MNIKVEIERDASMRGYAIWVTNQLPNEAIQLAKPVELQFSPVDYSAAYPEPTLRLYGADADDFLRGFANALVASGFKTDELGNVNQEIVAIKYHLEDMRTLVFKKPKGEN